MQLIFNRHSVLAHRNRYAAHLSDHDFLLTLGANHLSERWEDFRREVRYLLDLGSYTGQLYQAFIHQLNPVYYIQTDFSLSMLKHSLAQPTLSVVADEETLPFAAGSFDLILSNLTLHWVNDLPGSLIQIRQTLQKDGLFLATMFGSQTLQELRHVFMVCESKLYDQISTRICPFTDVKTAGMLLQRTGFSAPVSDSDLFTVSYPNIYHLLHDIRYSAQSNPMLSARPYFTPALLAEAAKTYQELYPSEDGGITATFELINLTGLGC